MPISLHVGDCENEQEVFGGLCAPPEKLWRICVIPLTASNYIANSAIILYSVCLVCLSSHFGKLGQSDLDKKIDTKNL